MLSKRSIRSRRSRLKRGAYGRGNCAEYRSPQFGYAVTWTNPWSLLDNDGPLDSTVVPGTDNIVIGSNEAGRAQVGIVGAARENLLGPAETVQFWSSTDYLSDFMEPGTVVVLSEYTPSSAVVVMVSPGVVSGIPIVTIKESYDIPRNASVRVTVTVDLDVFDEVYRKLQSTLQINHQALLRECRGDVLSSVLPAL